MILITNCHALYGVQSKDVQYVRQDVRRGFNPKVKNE